MRGIENEKRTCRTRSAFGVSGNSADDLGDDEGKGRRGGKLLGENNGQYGGKKGSPRKTERAE